MTDPRQDTRPTSGRTELTARYGRTGRSRRPLLLALAAVLVLVALGWLIWVAVEHSTPPVASRLVGFEVTSPTSTTATIEVERSEDVVASCRLQAKASDFSVVGEVTVTVAADAPRRHLVTAAITTQRDATSVT
ncbi:MAG: DUF4307 domain-containing protein, partial [Nocardioidaceae bacterium]